MDGALEYIALGNAILLAAFLAVWLFEIGLRLAGYRHAYKLRLNLAIAGLCAAALPLVLAPLGGLLSSITSINATDLIVSQYLKGNIGLSATQLSDVLLAKNVLISDLVSAASITSMAFIAAFLTAALLRAAYIGLSIWRVYRLVTRSAHYRDSRRVSVRISDDIEVPFSTRGLFRYFIVIPRSMMANTRATRMAVGHEAQHIRQRDVDWEILLSLVSPLFAINPAFWFISDRIRRFREYSCDSAFLHFRNFDAKEYCLLLLDIASKARRGRGPKGSTALAASVPFFGREGLFARSSHSALRQRVVALASDAGRFQSGMFRVVNVVPAFLLLGLMALTVEFSAKPADWSQDRLTLSTVVNLERLDRINTFGVAPLR